MLLCHLTQLKLTNLLNGYQGKKHLVLNHWGCILQYRLIMILYLAILILCLNMHGIRSRYSDHPSDKGEVEKKKKERRSWHLANFPPLISPAELKALIFSLSQSLLSLSFSALPLFALHNNEVPLPTIDCHSLSLSFAFVDRRCQSSSSPFLPISLSNSHSLSLALPLFWIKIAIFFFLSFHYASHLLTCPVAWAFSFTALRP